jgi:hypothetical protein
MPGRAPRDWRASGSLGSPPAHRAASIGNRGSLAALSLRRTVWLDREIVRRIPGRRTNRRLLPCFARARHHAVALARARAQDPVVADQVETGRRDTGRELLDELLGLEDDVGRAVAPAVLQAIEEPPILEAGESLGRHRRRARRAAGRASARPRPPAGTRAGPRRTRRSRSGSRAPPRARPAAWRRSAFRDTPHGPAVVASWRAWWRSP